MSAGACSAIWAATDATANEGQAMIAEDAPSRTSAMLEETCARAMSSSGMCRGFLPVRAISSATACS